MGKTRLLCRAGEVAEVSFSLLYSLSLDEDMSGDWRREMRLLRGDFFRLEVRVTSLGGVVWLRLSVKLKSLGGIEP